MKALKACPYPSAPLDPSVFEEITDEYAAVSVKSVASRGVTVPRTSDETLAHLVRSKSYDAAERVRAELLEMGVDIQLDAVYEEIAIEALKTKGHSAAFAQWFILIPEAHAMKPRSFHHIRRLLFNQSTTPNLPLIMRFGLICAAKGYGRKIASQAIPFVVRFAEPDVSNRFLDQFEKASMAYLQRFYPKEIKKW
jgi:hypothetical protein